MEVIMAKKSIEVPAIRLSDSLGELHKMITIVEDCMEKGEEIPDSLIPAMETSVENFQSSIDRRINAIEKLDWFTQYLSAQAKQLKDKEKTLKGVLERIKENTKYHVEANPDLDWKGSVKRLAIQANGQVPRQWLIETINVTNVIDVNDLNKVPEAYVRKETVYVLDKERVSRDVQWNEELETVCRLGERGSHLRIR
jgi:hypothetical protein